MTNRKTSNKNEESSSSPKGGLVQFRADDRLLADLAMVAERLNLPIGVLARLWVSERLHSELSFDIATIEAWRAERYKEIDKIIAEQFCPGPIQVLHIVPFHRLLDIEPDHVRMFQGMLAPIEDASGVTGRINLEGYQTIKQFSSAEALAGTVQVFRGGQLESVRVLRTDDQNCIYANEMEEHFIRAVWSYCCALEALDVKPPLALFAGFKRMRGCRLTSQRFSSPSADITYGEFQVKGLTISSWGEVLKIEYAAQKVKSVLDQVANSAGLARSMSYSAKGEWLGPIDRPDSYVRQTRMIARTEVIELAGINRDANRVELVLHDNSSELVAGKVRAPYLETTEKTRFKILVNQDEMAAGVKESLKHKFETKQPVKFSAGKLNFSGLITSFTQGSGAGAGSFADANLPQERVLMLSVEPRMRAQTPNQCTSCKRPIVPGQELSIPNGGTLCRQCRE